MPQILTTGNGGWVRYEDDDLDPSVFVRFEERKGRLTPVDLFLPGAHGLGTDLLRRIPLGLIEAWANEPDVADGLRQHLRTPGPDLRRAVSYFDGRPKGDNWVARMLDAQRADSPERAPRMRPLAEFGPKEKAPATREVVDARLKIPEGTRYGDDFYRQVASVYNQLARQTKGPGAAMADANHVNTTTTHRWIREARRRGFLPPGRRGKAG